MSMKSNIEETLMNLRQSFQSGKTRNVSWRLSQLRAMRTMLENNDEAISRALFEDMHKPSFESIALEICATLVDLNHILNNLESWLKPNYQACPPVMLPCTHEIIQEPYGLCLIISPFNYPINLTLAPLLGCIAAGNVCCVKPSELSSASESLLIKLFAQYLDPECIQIISGDASIGAELLKQKWDFIFYTGSVRVGKLVASSAAATLTPYLLELGGKSPTYIDTSTQDLALVARRVIWGRMTSAGQTCIAPDYVMCHKDVYEAFINEANKCIKQFYGDDPQKSFDLSRIITREATARLQKLLLESEGTIICGGKVDVDSKYVAPTLIVDIDWSSPIMQEEIFGPILPVLKVSNVSEAIERANQVGRNPLVSYIFCKNRQVIDHYIEGVTSGDVVVNDVMFHIANPNIPFGGVGNSGSGAYKGRHSLEAFSFKRSILRRDDHSVFDISLRYPPYTPLHIRVFKAVGALPQVPHVGVSGALLLGAAVMVVILGISLKT